MNNMSEKDCLSCVNSFSEPCEDGDILHCMEHNEEIVEPSGWCNDYA